jgi:hypothetical protein
MGWAFLYVAFGIVALWLLGEVLFQYKARLRWRALAFSGFLCVVVGALVPSIVVIGVGIAAFATGQTFVTLSHRRGFVTGWALGGGPGTSRRRRGGQGPGGDAEQREYEHEYQDGHPDQERGEYGEYGEYGPGGQESEAERTQVAHGADDLFARGGYDPAEYEPDDVFTPGGYPAQTFPAGDYTGNGYHDNDYAAHGYDQGTYDPAAYAAFEGNGTSGGYGPYEGLGGHGDLGGDGFGHDGFGDDGFGGGPGAGQPPQEQPVPVYQPGPLPGETAEFVFGQGVVDPAGAGPRGGYQGLPEPSYDAAGQQQAAGYAVPYGGYDAGGQYAGAPYGGYADDGFDGFGQSGPADQGVQGAGGHGDAPQPPYDPYGGGYGTGYDGGYGGQQPYSEPGPQGGAWVPQQRDMGEPLPPEQQPYPSYQPYGHGSDPANNGYYYDD